MIRLPKLYVMFAATFLVLSCKHEVPLPVAKTTGIWIIDTIVDRGDILDLGVSDTQVCFKNAKPEIGVINRETGVLKFFSQFNSRVFNVAQIKSVSDADVLLCDEKNGLYRIDHNGLIVLDSSENYDGFDYSGDSCWANRFGVFLKTNGVESKLANGFRFGSGQLVELAALGTTCWVGTRGNGLYEIDMPRRSLNIVDRLKLPSAAIRQMFISTDRKLWVVTELGISVYDGTTWVKYQVKPNTKIYHVTFYQGKTYVASDHGVYLFDKMTGEFILDQPLSDKLSNKRINVVEAQGGDLWIGSEAGLFRCYLE